MIDHFLVLNLLAFGDIIDSNLFPTLLFVEPVSTNVSTLPVNPFSRPITLGGALSTRRRGLPDKGSHRGRIRGCRGRTRDARR